MSDELLSNIPNHLYGDGFVVPNAPAFGKAVEDKMIAKLKVLRNKAFNPRTKQLWGRDEHGNASNAKKHWGTSKKTNARAVAAYENERHEVSLKYSFVPYKTATELSKQCHGGMGFDDLFNVGFAAVLTAVDKWPGFEEDKGPRIFNSIQRAVHNAICRFLDDFNRAIRVPSYKLSQLTVRLDVKSILYGKFKKQKLLGKDKNGEKKYKYCLGENCCGACPTQHKGNCRRNKPGKFESKIVDLAKKLELDITDFDGKSLRDIAIETGEYRAIAEIANVDVIATVSILEPTVSIDVPVGDENEDSVADLIPVDKEDRARLIYMRETLEEALDKIPERNAQILKDYFYEGLSIRDIAEKYDFSAVRANQMIKKSINRVLGTPEAMNILNHKIAGRL